MKTRIAGDHDVNISYAECEKQMSEKQLAAEIREKSTALYQAAAEYALTKGIIICDTKFEFGLDENGTLTLWTNYLPIQVVLVW